MINCYEIFIHERKLQVEEGRINLFFSSLYFSRDNWTTFVFFDSPWTVIFLYESLVNIHLKFFPKKRGSWKIQPPKIFKSFNRHYNEVCIYIFIMKYLIWKYSFAKKLSRKQRFYGNFSICFAEIFSVRFSFLISMDLWAQQPQQISYSFLVRTVQNYLQ